MMDDDWEGIFAEVHKLPSLQDICIDNIANNLLIIRKYLRPKSVTLESQVVLELIRRSIETITPEDVIILYNICPTIDSNEDVDQIFWKKHVEKRFPNRRLKNPFNEMLRIISQIKGKLESTEEFSNEEKLKLLQQLSSYPFSVELFQKTKIGIVVNNIRKSSPNKEILDYCNYLLNIWKEAKQKLTEDYETSGSHHDLEINKLSVRIITWKDLYELCLGDEHIKFENCASKLKEKIETAKDSRRITKQINFNKSATNLHRKFNTHHDGVKSVRAAYGAHTPSTSPIFTTNKNKSISNSSHVKVPSTNDHHNAAVELKYKKRMISQLASSVATASIPPSDSNSKFKFTVSPPAMKASSKSTSLSQSPSVRPVASPFLGRASLSSKQSNVISPRINSDRTASKPINKKLRMIEE